MHVTCRKLASEGLSERTYAVEGMSAIVPNFS